MNKQLAERNYPNDWEVTPLVNFASNKQNSFVDGPFGSDLKVSDYVEFGVRVLQLQNLGDGVFKDKNKIYTSIEKARQLSRCQTLPGDIVIAKMAEPLARAVLVPEFNEKYLIVADLMKLRTGEDVDPFYLINFVNFDDFRREAERLSTGTTRTRISLSTLKSISLPKPPYGQQQKIALILTTVDNLIEKTQALIDKYTAIKQGMMADLFTRGIDLSGTPETNPSYGQLRPPVEQAPELYKQTELGWIPKEWEIRSAIDVCETVIDCKNRTPPEATEGYIVLKTFNIKNGVLEFERLTYTDEKSFLIWTTRGEPKEGDIVITREAPIGESFIIEKEMAKMCLGQRMMLYRPDATVINPSFMYQMTRARMIQARLIELAGGSTVGHVRVGDIKNLKFHVPSLKEQLIIARSINSINFGLNKENRYLNKLKLQKKGLMQDLLTGTIRVI